MVPHWNRISGSMSENRLRAVSYVPNFSTKHIGRIADKATTLSS